MSEKERAVCRLLCARCLAQFLPHHEYDATLAQLLWADLTLHVRGKRVIGMAGAVSLMSCVNLTPLTIESHARRFPALAAAMACGVVSAGLKGLQTQPPNQSHGESSSKR